MDIQPDMGAAHQRVYFSPFLYFTELGVDCETHDRNPIERDNEQ